MDRLLRSHHAWEACLVCIRIAQRLLLLLADDGQHLRDTQTNSLAVWHKR